jgi:hypothetical protein
MGKRSDETKTVDVGLDLTVSMQWQEGHLEVHWSNSGPPWPVERALKYARAAQAAVAKRADDLRVVVNALEEMQQKDASSGDDPGASS